jgi:hypothetical protein
MGVHASPIQIYFTHWQVTAARTSCYPEVSDAAALLSLVFAVQSAKKAESSLL